RPLALRVALFQQLAGTAEMARVVGFLVAGDAGPIAGFRRAAALRIAVADRQKPLLGLGEALLVKFQLPQPQFELGEEILDGQESLDAVPLLPLGVEHDLRRRPGGAEAI